MPVFSPSLLSRKNIRTMLVQSLQSVSLLDPNFPSLPSVPGLTIENWPGRGVGRVFTEAGENGQDLEVSPTPGPSGERDQLELTGCIRPI
jgi:hypothetical protein